MALITYQNIKTYLPTDHKELHAQGAIAEVNRLLQAYGFVLESQADTKKTFVAKRGGVQGIFRIYHLNPTPTPTVKIFSPCGDDITSCLDFYFVKNPTLKRFEMIKFSKQLDNDYTIDVQGTWNSFDTFSVSEMPELFSAVVNYVAQKADLLSGSGTFIKSNTIGDTKIDFIQTNDVASAKLNLLKVIKSIC